MAKKYKHKRLYKEEILDEETDNGTMVDSKNALAEAVVGHKIVSVSPEGRIILDNGKAVTLVGESDCCAYTELEGFLLHPEMVDHIITGVGTTDGYQTWHIYADMGDVLKLDVGWSAGNPFYYAYGFHIMVEDL